MLEHSLLPHEKTVITAVKNTPPSTKVSDVLEKMKKKQAAAITSCHSHNFPLTKLPAPASAEGVAMATVGTTSAAL